MATPQLVYSMISHGHLGSLCILAIANKVAMNIQDFEFFFGWSPRSAVLYCMVSTCLILQETTILFST